MPISKQDGPHNFWMTTWNAVPGVYVIANASGQVIYVGQTDNLQRRMAEHRADTTHCMHRYGPSLVWVEVVTTGEVDRRLRERQLILEYRPFCNVA